VQDGDSRSGDGPRTGAPRWRGGTAAARYWSVLPLAVLGVALAAGALDGVAADMLASVAAFDRASMSLVVSFRHPVATKAMTSVTGLGSASAAVVFLGVCHLAGWERELRVAAVALAVTGVVVASLMALVQRPFPVQPVCITDEGLTAHSFPSGHAAAVTVFAAVARESDTLPFGVVAAGAALVAASRVYLGTHYLSDTLAGVAIGVAAVALARRYLGRNPTPSASLRSVFP
jgi:undecaprenyl-diphosphatase